MCVSIEEKRSKIKIICLSDTRREEKLNAVGKVQFLKSQMH